jgi:TolB-like protein/Tfp pilus assembly protein PilF
MIDKDGNARIMDFGIARSLKGKGITDAGVMIGTPEYMSPEQVEGKDIDLRSDIYSLGVILYEMVTGGVPFEGSTPFTIGVKHKSETPKDPREINAQIPEDLSGAILKCLDKDKENRYQSTEELRSVLIRIDEGIPSEEKVIPKRKPMTSREITVTFGMKKLIIPALVVFVLVIAVVFVWQLLPKEESVSLPPGKPSIAVLPFTDLSPQEDQAYLCDGLAEELINRLTKVESLRVPARTSSFSFRGKDLGIQEIGQKLNVENVLEGSIRRAGNKLRITVQLVEVEDGYPIWSEQYERNLEDIFAIQDDISMAIVDNLKIELLGKEKVELVKSSTQDLEAFDLYLNGRYFWNKRTEESLNKAVDRFQQAIKRDPSYALAYAGLADSYLIIGAWGFLPPKEVFPRAKQAAIKALEIDDLLAEAQNALAFVKFVYDWEWQDADIAFQRAIALNPNYSTTHLYYSEYLCRMGRFDEALSEISRAQELDPLSLINSAWMAVVFIYKGEYDKAIEQSKKTLEMDPNFRPAHSYLGSAYRGKGMYENALAEYEIINSHANIGITYAKMGKISESKKVLSELIERLKHMYVPPDDIACIYFALGDNDQGFAWLERAYEEREYGLSSLKVSRKYDSIRSDPRFKALLRRMNWE